MLQCLAAGREPILSSMYVPVVATTGTAIPASQLLPKFDLYCQSKLSNRKSTIRPLVITGATGTLGERLPVRHPGHPLQSLNSSGNGYHGSGI